MILLDIAAAVLLIPLTLFMMILFNVYVQHWLYWAGITLFGWFYAVYFAWIVNANSTGVFILLIILYVIRMKYLAYQLHTRSDHYPVLQGQFKNRNIRLHMGFYFPLAFLNLLKLLPTRIINRELTRQLGSEIEITHLIDLVLDHSKGARIEINHEQIDFCIEIQ